MAAPVIVCGGRDEDGRERLGKTDQADACAVQATDVGPLCLAFGSVG